jgi:hypothetical protein
MQDKKNPRHLTGSDQPGGDANQKFIQRSIANDWMV